MTPSLTELANKYGSDKGTKGPSDNWHVHNYTDVYDAYLSPLRSRPITILEVGLGVPGDFWDARIAHGRNTGGGASLKMWHDYFTKGAIYGADINAAPHLDNERTKTFVLDQGDAAQLDRFARETGVRFDVIIDDGSHRPDHQQITLAALFPYLKPGGLYFIEDLESNGRGDGNTSRHSADTVLNTRKVLRRFANTGNFPKPHALGNGAALAADIASVEFHVPVIRFETPEGAAHPRKTYVERSEELCVIRKALPGWRTQLDSLRANAVALSVKVDHRVRRARARR